MIRAALFLGCISLTTPLSAATIVNFAGGSGELPAGTVVIETFENEAVGATLGTKAFVYNMNVSGQSARPAYGSTGNFGAVWSGGSYSKHFGPTKLFAFALGSLDTYNKLTLRYEDNSQLVLSGGQIINGMSFPSGNQISGGSNGVVSYTVTSGPRLTGATFTSSGNSFEFDNLAIAAVPEPATWAMMIGGLGLAGFGLRRRKREAEAFA